MVGEGKPAGGSETAATWYLLEQRQVFSQSLLWDLQQRYFAEKGIEAWRQDEVPFYVTSSPTLANSYAEMVFAFWRDQQHVARSSEPLHVCELGAGAGRFASHFLRRLTALCAQANIAPTTFRYVLTDFTQSNLDFWRQHPGFQAFFADGLLNIALFDIVRSEQLSLQLSGTTLSTGSLDRPLVVIANYVFDSIPQDLYFIEEQRCSACLISLIVDAPLETLSAAELLARVRYHYEYQPLTAAPYQDPSLQHLLTQYERTMSRAHLLFPAPGLRCLQRLQALSRHGLLVLSADKGDHRLQALEGRSAPSLVHHGSFSLLVNYHAFQAFCEQRGGLALFPERHNAHINVGCLLLLDDAQDYQETRRAYQRCVQNFGPDDFYTIANHARQHLASMTTEDMLAYVRLSAYDSHQFARYLPRLMELAPAFTHDEREAVQDVIERVWALYFPLGEAQDLAYAIASLLYAMNDYARALTYFERSITLYGQHTGTLYNMAACYHLLERHEEAQRLAHIVLHYEPENEQARAFLGDDERECQHESVRASAED